MWRVLAAAGVMATLSCGVQGSATSCLPHRYQPSNVTIVLGEPNTEAKSLYATKPRVLVNGEDFEIKGVGYSPIPPGKNTLKEQFDYFTSATDYIWKRDIPIIAAMGANVIRTWSWDATLDHTPFMDLCDKHGLKVLVPFLVTPTIYPTIDSPEAHRQMFTDWKAFVRRIKNHPALLGYMIGNELNDAFAGQYDTLFSIVNTMATIRDNEDAMRHPITMPFSDSMFLEDLVEKYYPWLKIDFWSLQIYRDAPSLQMVSEKYTKLFLKASSSGFGPSSPTDGLYQHLPVKPLVFTEYGIDSLIESGCDAWNKSCTQQTLDILSNPHKPIPQNVSKQALGFCQRFEVIHKGTTNTKGDEKDMVYINGGIIMEYVDEWWKGSFPDVRRAGCPNQRTDLHTYCSHNINKHNNATAYFLHEEWLGLFEQEPSLVSKNKLVQSMDMCIRPRLSFCVMKEMFRNSESSCGNAMAACLKDEAQWSKLHCSSKKDFHNNFILIWVVPPVLIFIAVLFILRCRVERDWVVMLKSAICFWKPPPKSSKQKQHEEDELQKRESRVMVIDEEHAKETDRLVAPPVSPAAGGRSLSSRQIHSVDEADPEVRAARQRAKDEVIAALEDDITHAFWIFTTTCSEDKEFESWWMKRQAEGEVGFCNIEGFISSHLAKKKNPHFGVSQKKLLHMISDVFLRVSAESEVIENHRSEYTALMNKAIRVVHEKYTEGFYLYLNKASMPSELVRSDRIRALSLYMLIQQWSGTINHAPEKICELLDWATKCFESLAEVDKEQLINKETAEENWQNRVLRITDFHHGLVEIIRTYCMKVTEGFSFDDINSDSLYLRKTRKGEKAAVGREAVTIGPIASAKSKALSFTMGTEGDLLPEKSPSINRRNAIHGSHLEYNSACKPEECVQSSSGNEFFESRLRSAGQKKAEPGAKGQRKALRFFPDHIAFPQRGGVFSLVLNFQWLLRYLLWQNLIASYMQSFGTPECASSFLMHQLAFFDSALCFLGCIFHRVILQRYKRRLKIETAFYGISFIGIALINTLEPYLAFLKHIDGAAHDSSAPVLHLGTGFSIDVALVYLVFTFLYTAGDEIRLFWWTLQASTMKGRFKNTTEIRRVRLGYVCSVLIAGIGGVVLVAKNIMDYTWWNWWPDVDEYVTFGALVVLSLVVGRWLSLSLPSTKGKGGLTKAEILCESNYIFSNIIFWGIFFAANWLLSFLVLIPSVNDVGMHMCECTKGTMELDQDQVEHCEGRTHMMCYVGVIFVWISAYLVSFVFLFAVFELLLLVFGVARAKYLRVGNVQDWHDVESYWSSILKNSLPRVSGSLHSEIGGPVRSKQNLGKLFESDGAAAMELEEHQREQIEGVSRPQSLIWNNFVDSMRQDYLLSREEADALKVQSGEASEVATEKASLDEAIQSLQVERAAAKDAAQTQKIDAELKKKKARRLELELKADASLTEQLVPNFRLKPRAKEAQRRVVTFLWGLESLAAHEGNFETATLKDEQGRAHNFTSPWRQAHRVSAAPSFTTLVPVYNEPILLSRTVIKKTRDAGMMSKRVSELEYLALTHVAEWQNFAQEMLKKHGAKWMVDSDNIGNDLLYAFLGHDHPRPLHDTTDAALISDVELWATMRGQTLARTINGLCNLRLGVEQLAILEEHRTMTPTAILELVARKYQLLISHQTFNMARVGAKNPAHDHMLQENALVEVFRREKYFEVVLNDDSQFQSHMWKLRDKLLFPALEDGQHAAIQQTAEGCYKVVDRIKKKQDELIGIQFDTLKAWSTDATKTRALPAGTMVRINIGGELFKKNIRDTDDDEISYADRKIIGGRWLEGVVTERIERKHQEDVVSVRVDSMDKVAQKYAGAKGAAKALEACGLKLQPNGDKGLFVKRDAGFFAAERDVLGRKRGWTITGVSVGGGAKQAPTIEKLAELFARREEVKLTFTKFGRWGDRNVCEYKVQLDDGRDIEGDSVTTGLCEYVEPFPWTSQTVQRVSRLKIGEGKAENQIHALQFARGEVLQAMDMNQYATSDQGIKIPFLLNDFFQTPDDRVMTRLSQWDHNMLIPPYRIVGFPEHCYTRNLSMVGELMGAAEWCFVTINQRVLNWPLRIRAHYGHPDFFDGYWARTRGGTSKASPKVNTNEDIFAGYEMLGRGERGSYVEFLEVHKGRETSFPKAYVFECKLAQGAAQQVRSFDVYTLNRKLDVFQRFGLFYGSLAFYLTNFIMSISINYYILSIVLFAMSGVSYHELGLLDAVIAIPWLLQIGYVLALPMIVELVLQQGFWRGLVQFIVTLPVAVLFFIFHMRTKTYYFGKGMLVGAGGYASTGRGFGLDRHSMKQMYQIYSESHFIEGLIVFLCLVVYAIYGSDPIIPYLARTFTIILIALSWLWAPIIFNPMPTTQELQSDLASMMEWMTTKSRVPSRIEVEKMGTGLDAVHRARSLILEHNIEREERDARASAEEAAAAAASPDDGGSQSDGQSVQSTSHTEALRKACQEATLRWFAALQGTEHASFSWKKKVHKNSKPLTADPETREREVLVTILYPTSNWTESVGKFGDNNAFKMAILKALDIGGDEPELGADASDNGFEVTEVSGCPLWVLRCNDREGAKRVMRNYQEKVLEGRSLEGLVLHTEDGGVVVRLENFARWSKRRLPTFSDLDQMMKQFWMTEDGESDTAQDSWRSWYLQKTVFDIWMLEDEHSQTFGMTVAAQAIKLYLHAEFYLPWLLIAFAFFNVESCWLLFFGAFIAWLFHFINQNTIDRHDYPQSIKALTLVTAPLIFIYYHNAVITMKELLWSLAFYFLSVMLLQRLYMGTCNVLAKYAAHSQQAQEASERKAKQSNVNSKFLDVRNNGRDEEQATKDDGPGITAAESDRLINARREDVMRINAQEKTKSVLFTKRLGISELGTAFRSIVPFFIMLLLTVGNIVAVIMSTWLTAMMYNGSVAEAWRKAYFRSSVASPPPSTDNGGRPGVTTVMTGDSTASASQQAIRDSLLTSSASVPIRKTTRRRPVRGVSPTRGPHVQRDSTVPVGAAIQECI